VAPAGDVVVTTLPSFAQVTPVQVPAVTTAPRWRWSERVATPEPDSVSVQATEYVAKLWVVVVPSSGAVKSVAGAVTSIVTDRAALAAPVLPAGSVALAVIEWLPAERVEVVIVQAPPVAVPLPTGLAAS
jgi:hypothetical protein